MMTITEQIALAEERGARAGWRGWAALCVLMLPVLLVSVDNTVLSFALPSIARDLAPTSVQQLWIIDAYPLVLAGLLVTMGTLGDRFGRRRLLLVGAAGFGIVSVVAAFASTAEALIASRAAMGFFGAMLMPSTMSLLRSIFTQRKQRRIAIAIWASMFSAGAAVGPIVGGLLLEHYEWGAVFLLAVPVLVPLLILAPLLVPESRDPRPGRVDGASILLSMLAMAPFVYAIKDLAIEGPSALVAILIAISISSGALFVRRQLRLEAPMLDMRLFQRGVFSGALLVNMLSVIALVGFLYFVAQHLQLVMGLTPLQSGLALVPGLAAIIVSGLLVVPIAQRVSPRIIVPTALSLSAAGYVFVAMSTGATQLVELMLAFVLLGVGIGAAETVSNELVVSNAPPAKAGAAAAVSETAYELGAVLGTTILGGILTAQYRAQLVLPEGISADAAHRARETLAGAMDVAQTSGGVTGAGVAEAAATAFEAGVSATSVLGAVLVCVAGIIAATTLGVSRRASKS